MGSGTQAIYLGAWEASACKTVALFMVQILACDFFTLETIGLQTLYVFFFIELGSRRVQLAGITAYPTQPWVAQQARQYFTWMRFLHHTGC
jgi:hypothetical protein